MVPLIVDNKEKVGNVVWIEDYWEPHVEALFPEDLKKLILKTHNFFEKHINLLSAQEKITHSFNYCATNLSETLEQVRTGPVHITVSQEPIQSWNKIINAYLNLINLKGRESIDQVIIQCRPLTAREGHVMTNMKMTSAGILDACLLHYHLKDQGPQIRILKSSIDQKDLIENIMAFIKEELGIINQSKERRA